MSRYNKDEDNKIRRKKVGLDNSTMNSVREKKQNRVQEKTNHVNKTNKSTYHKKRVSKKRKSRNKLKKYIKRFLVAILTGLMILATIGLLLVVTVVKDLQKIDKATIEASYISQNIASSEEIPQELKDAIVAIEDERFYSHKGVDYKSLVRVFLHNITSNTTQGGSTIEMQISKNLLTESDQNITRKITDMYYALQMNKIMTKDEILVAYLNNIYLARSSYGVKDGSLAYFGKEVSELSLAESAMLVGITNNPARYRDYDEAKKRQETILYKMNELGYITDEEYSMALVEPVTFK